MNDARGFSMVELMMVMGLVCVLTAIAMPTVMRARMTGNEASAVGSVRTIMAAQQTYSASCMAGAFAVTLDDLAKPAPGNNQAFVGPEIGHNGIMKSGYILEVQRDGLVGVADVGSPAETCNSSVGQPVSSYFVHGDPASPGITGIRFFAADPRNTIYTDSIPITNPLTPGGTVVPLQ